MHFLNSSSSTFNKFDKNIITESIFDGKKVK